MARYGGYVLGERLVGYRPRSADEVPPSAEAITPRWLTSVLCGDVTGACVTAVECVGGSDGTNNRRALTVSYNAAGRTAGLPTRIFSKSTTFFKTRLLAGTIGRTANEVGFYSEFRDDVDIESLSALYAVRHAPSGRSMILFEDVVATRNVRFLDPFCVVTRDMVEDMLSVLAAYHGKFWQDSRLKRRPWLRTPLEYQRIKNRALPYEKLSNLGIDRGQAVLPPNFPGLKRALWEGHTRSLEICSQRPFTLLHGDLHIGNWYQTPQGRMGLSDWGANKGQWAMDYSYALISALEIEDRRAWEKDLLAFYLGRLKAAGVTAPPSFDSAWLAYRQQVFHAFYFWAITTGAGRLQPNMQPQEISLRNLKRVGQALEDLDSLGSL